MNTAAMPALPTLARVTHVVRESPSLSAMEIRAREIWSFCEGWHPERFPIAFALMPVDDVEMIVELMKEIRDYVIERREFEERVKDLNRIH